MVTISHLRSQSLNLGLHSSNLRLCSSFGFSIPPVILGAACACGLGTILGTGDPELRLSLFPPFPPQAGAVLGTPASCRTKSEYSFLPFLLHPPELCPLSPLLLSLFPTPDKIPVVIAGVTPAPLVGKLFASETPNSSSEEQDSYFSI